MADEDELNNVQRNITTNGLIPFEDRTHALSLPGTLDEGATQALYRVS
jgi:hypothetical protein